MFPIDFCHIPVSIIKRSAGRSAVAAAAYRSGTKLTNEWDGMTHDYTRKSGIVHAEIMLPAHAPPEFADRSILWNSVEQIEKARDSQLAREIEAALPRELSGEQQLALVRAAWAAYINRALESAGRPERIDHRSYKRQGIYKIPSVHLGPAASQMEKRGIRTDKGEVNRQIAALFSFLQANGIQSMQQLHEKIADMNSRYYDLRGTIVKAERRIATLTERREMWEQYNQYKSIHKQLAKVKPEKREQFEQRHSRELILYDAAARYLKELKDSGEGITPKAWQREIDQLAAGKQADTLAMKSMREDLKAVEQLRKTAEQLSRQERDKPHDREPDW